MKHASRSGNFPPSNPRKEKGNNELIVDSRRIRGDAVLEFSAIKV